MAKAKDLRLCRVDDEFGYFHCFEQWSNVVDASPLRGGHPGGVVAQVFGIVEFKNGEVRRVDPTKIKFRDEINLGLSIMSEYEKEDQDV